MADRDTEQAADLAANPFVHRREDSAEGEKCWCLAPATHKVAEETWSERHPWTAYVCCRHFGQIMGEKAKQWCAGLFGKAFQ